MRMHSRTILITSWLIYTSISSREISILRNREATGFRECLQDCYETRFTWRSFFRDDGKNVVMYKSEHLDCLTFVGAQEAVTADIEESSDKTRGDISRRQVQCPGQPCPAIGERIVVFAD